MKPLNFLIFILVFFSKIPFIKSSECVGTKNLNIGFLQNEFIDYEPYLYYELGKFASKSEISFKVELVEDNYDKFDIIFGEYQDLKIFQNKELTLNTEILDFYKRNNIQISGNILPLDLDTFIILSKDNQKEFSFDELSNFFNPMQYSLGANLLYKDQLIKLITYNLNGAPLEENDINLEYLLSLYSSTYENLNKNIIESNFIELVESFDSNENTFTVFSDGILLNKNINYRYFQLFPTTKYLWSEVEGIFERSTMNNPISFFGFSAYINNQEDLGFICHLMDKNIRENTFRNFNLQISPLSEREVEDISLNIPINYKEILLNKNKNIYELDSYGIKNYEKFIQIMSGKREFKELINSDNYLN